MQSSLNTDNDALRWRILERLQLLNADQNLEFDRLTQVAARALGTSVALITFIGPDRQWIPSRFGWTRETTSLDEAFCVCALDTLHLLEVPDATADARFRDNPLVTGPEGVRFYAGHPLVFEGIVLGTLCVLADHPRILNGVERETLGDLAAIATDLISQRNERLLRAEHEARVVVLGDALQGSEAMLADAQRVAKIGSWELHARTGESRFSAGIFRLLGRDSVPLDFSDFQACFRAPEWWQWIDLSKPVELALDIVGGDGETRWFNWISRPMEAADGSRDRIIGMLQDVTQATLAQRHLRTVEERFRLLWETTPDVVLMLDEQSRIQFANPAVYNMFGHSPDALVGQDLSVLQPERLRKLHRQGFQRYLSSGIRRLDWRAVEATGLHAEGHEIPVEISFSDMELEGHRVFAACMRDISARKASETQNNELARQLRNAQKMEAIGALAGGIAHDFNNVLAGILGNSALALDELDPGHDARKFVEQIQNGGRRGRELVKQILSFARRQPQTLSLCSLNELVRQNMDLLQTTVPKEVDLQLNLSSADCCIKADVTQLAQVIANLVTNAWQAIRAGPGMVEVGAQAQLLDASMANKLRLQTGRYAHLWVRDTGQGMDEATAARVFEPFFTTKSVGDGTGLGLAVVHGIVGAHGGGICIDSKPDHGSTFHVYLPMSEAEPAACEKVGAIITKQQGCGQHVLYVDDDEVMIVMVERLLKKLGYRPTVMSCARETLAAVELNPDGFDLVLTDFDMPDLTGLQLAERLLVIRPELPIVISSGNVTNELRQEADRLGVRALIEKQNTIEELGNVLNTALS
ncbi:PAS domain S-box protein [Paucibacter sp. O1-1]|nr:PAS domain S-box protein [Paucibacter sp. O1-1]MDA3831262.1 PAS domain S-box protein [Paucibacter sp. O1-1]